VDEDAGVKFRLPDGTCVAADFCERNLNILAHAQSIELEIGSRCGGHGVCGGDRVKVAPAAHALLSPVTAAEREHLSAAELGDGWRLACQAYPERSQRAIEVTISIPSK
jgi:ferredoxin